MNVLMPIADSRKDYPSCGVIEVEVESEQIVWSFEASNPQRFYQDGIFVKHEGFRPTSVQRLNDGNTLVSGWDNILIIGEDGEIKEELTHPQFNDVHETKLTDINRFLTFLVSSSGMDTLIELDKEGNEIWRWRLWEHIPEKLRPDKYYPPFWVDKDVRDMAWTPDKRFHLNYCKYLDKHTILASALHLGVFLIDRQSGEITKRTNPLNSYHNPYILENGNILVADYFGNCIAEIDWDENVHWTFRDNDNNIYPKDCDPLRSNSNEILVADPYNNRVFIVDVENNEITWEFLLEGSHPYEADFLLTINGGEQK